MTQTIVRTPATTGAAPDDVTTGPSQRSGTRHGAGGLVVRGPHGPHGRGRDGLRHRGAGSAIESRIPDSFAMVIP